MYKDITKRRVWAKKFSRSKVARWRFYGLCATCGKEPDKDFKGKPRFRCPECRKQQMRQWLRRKNKAEVL